MVRWDELEVCEDRSHPATVVMIEKTLVESLLVSWIITLGPTMPIIFTTHTVRTDICERFFLEQAQ